MLAVPYYNQRLDVADPVWRGKACTITNLAMTLEYYSHVLKNMRIAVVGVDELVREGVEIGGYVKSIGWSHEHIVFLAHNHGLSAYKQEFRARDKTTADALAEDGIEKIACEVESKRPVIVSIRNKFDESRDLHTILIIGVERDERGVLAGFFYHDPDTETRAEGENQYVDAKTFTKHWRGLAIFFE